MAKERGDLGELLSFIRWLKGWSQDELAERARIDRGQLTRYEAGKKTPRPETFERIVSRAGVPLENIEALRRCLRLSRATLHAGRPAGPTAGLPEELDSGVLKAVQVPLELAREELTLLRSAPRQRQLTPPSPQDHLQVESLFEKLSTYPDEKQRLLVKGAESYREWLLCLRLCRASAKAAADDPEEALKLADLALLVSRHVSGSEGWRARLQGYCTAFLANAQRVRGDLPGAEETFARAWHLWRTGKDEAGLLSQARLLDLEASLRRGQRRFAEALRLHGQALQQAQPAVIGQFLLNQASTLQENGDHDAALRVLERATKLIDGESQARLRFGLRYNQTANLVRLGRAAEAARIAPEVRELAERLGNGIDLVRTRWLEGNIAAKLGHKEEALAALEQVRRDFEDRKIPYDYALASLDLALLYRGEGRFAEIRALAGEMLAIFRAQGVHREALGAVLLFQEAAARQQVTTELVQRLQGYLQQARGNPQLRFKG